MLFENLSLPPLTPNSRSYLNHFTQPDSIVPDPYNPQDWNRYSYVRNSPQKYIDPTGHNPECGPDGIFCNEGYSAWEKQILTKLFNEGGSDAIHGVLYILENDIHITIGEPFECKPEISGLPSTCHGDWQSLGDVHGWYEGDDLIVLNPNKGNNKNSMPGDWGLSIIIHEAWHIEQEFLVSHSKHGELEAYQVGLRVYMSLTGTPFSGLSEGQREMYNSKTGYEYGQNVQKYLPGYWNNKMFTTFGINWGVGLWLYPDEPLGGMP
jgi:hypothetical protein